MAHTSRPEDRLAAWGIDEKAESGGAQGSDRHRHSCPGAGRRRVRPSRPRRGRRAAPLRRAAAADAAAQRRRRRAPPIDDERDADPENGVDVPNASLMVIESAERFGLAQLHQLRGRVGRGARDSACILLFGGPLSSNARERLKVIFENADGFEIARRDLLLRGPGEYLGERQSGVPLLRFADIEHDGDLVRAAREAAAELIGADPEAARAHVARWLGSRQDLTYA